MSETLFSRSIRLRYLEAVLFTAGSANTSTLTALGITRQQASADIDEYLRIAGPVMVYKPRLKTYTVDRRRKPKLVRPDDMAGVVAAVELLTKSASLNASAARITRRP